MDLGKETRRGNERRSEEKIGRETPYTVLKAFEFPRYNTKYSGENEILCEIFRVVSFSSTFCVISRKFGLLFGPWRNKWSGPGG